MNEREWRPYTAEVQEVWNANAAYWDDYMGEGNDFVEVLCWPALERLLGLQPGERVLDVACGNGLTSRRLGRLGAEVVAFDVAEQMIERARQRTTPEDGAIDYRILDASDEAALLSLGRGTFDAALCNMALFDMAEIDPLWRALARLLRPGGRFVFSMMHPCFNQAHVAHFVEMQDREGEIITTYGVKVTGYMTPTVNRGLALWGQPRAQPYFHRPLQMLLGSGFRAGFVLDGLEERAFSPDHPPGRNPVSWSGKYSEIPPVMVLRLRLP